MNIEDDLPNIDYVENPSERLPCVLVVDGSASMVNNDAIGQLNQGLQTFASELNGHAKARRSVRLKMIRCGGTVETLVEWTDASNFNPPIVDANGNTPLGRAVSYALDEIESEKRRLDSQRISRKRAWLFIFTDGEPTDEWESIAARCRQLEQSSSISCYGIAVNGANTKNLAQFSGENRPLELESADFIAFFKFLSQNMKNASGSAKGASIDSQTPWKFKT